MRTIAIGVIFAVMAMAAPRNCGPKASLVDTPLTTVGVDFSRAYGGGYPAGPPPLPFISRQDTAQGLAVDGAGNVYLSGIAVTAEFPYTHSLVPAPIGSGSCFVMKLDPAGNTIYSVPIPRSGSGVCLVAADADGYAYVTGDVSWPDFPSTAGAFQRSVRGSTDVFVVKLDPAGSSIVFSTLLGGTGFDVPSGIAVDGFGRVYVGGTTGSADFPVLQAAQAAIGGETDAFLARLNPEGSALEYATFLGGAGTESGAGVAVDPAGTAYIAGVVQAGDARDGFAAAVDYVGTLVYNRVLTAAPAAAIAADAQSNAYVTGTSSNDAFIAILDAFGETVSWKLLGGGGDDAGKGIVVDEQGSVYVTGSTTSDDFPTRNLNQARNSPGLCYFDSSQPGQPCQDTFVTRLDSAGAIEYSTFITAAGHDSANAIALGTCGVLYLAGYAQGPFPNITRTFLRVSQPAPQTPVPVPSSASLVKLVELPVAAGINAVVSGASYLSGLAPGGIVSVFGTGLLNTPGLVSATTEPLPRVLNGTQVLINGMAAPLYAVMKGPDWDQINFQLPFEATDSLITLQINDTIVSIPAAVVQPAVFTWDGSRVIAQHADYSLISTDAPARRNEVIILYAAGLGPVQPPVDSGVATPLAPYSEAQYPPSVQIGNQSAEVIFAGLTPGSIGLYQINVRVPDAAGPGATSLLIGGQTATLPVE